MLPYNRNLTNDELREILAKYRNEGRYDNDWLKEALLAQIVLELRGARI